MILGASTVYAAVPGFPRPDLGHPLFGCTVAWLALEVCRAHGVVLDNGFPATAKQRLRSWRTALLTVVFCALTGFSFSYLVVLFRHLAIESAPTPSTTRASSTKPPG
ncbi:hypothetical protein GCM10010372_43690 [Streptomyces tauricus]|uniref:hypothetical protein n=1 Tax=Streptomyces tauricus TaxID=68274 RepID=UPI001677CD97|nr:hypothetical protein [Streptomyces tauricus]GHA38786.1 hypothetical protein GCM10010372_43690 [Streptomyces tauricus]